MGMLNAALLKLFSTVVLKTNLFGFFSYFSVVSEHEQK